MTERLTKKNSNGEVILLVDGYYTRTEDRNLLKYAKKLAHYEDLEEQGRLVVLPEGYDKECLHDALRTWEKALKE